MAAHVLLLRVAGDLERITVVAGLCHALCLLDKDVALLGNSRLFAVESFALLYKVRAAAQVNLALVHLRRGPHLRRGLRDFFKSRWPGGTCVVSVLVRQIVHAF